MPKISESASAAAGRIGRRSRNMQEKRDRIFEAASALFAERGFEAVTTQAISDRADVAAGTLFRYASSKGELLLMVFNDQFRTAVELGREAASGAEDPADAVFKMVAPILDIASRDPVNAVTYQRELLFGSHAEQHRAEGLSLVSDLEKAIAHRLSEAVAHQNAAVEVAAMRAARSVFAVVHLLVAQPATGAHRDTEPTRELEEQVAQIVRGFLVSAGV